MSTSANTTESNPPVVPRVLIPPVVAKNLSLMTHDGEPGNFHFYPKLVPELMNMVNVQAGFMGSHVINLHLTHHGDPEPSTRAMPWKHLSFGEIDHPSASLLQVCRNFRHTLKSRYPAMGFVIKYSGWGAYGDRFDEMGRLIVYDLPCGHDENVGLQGNIAWNPDTDVVLITHKDEDEFATCADRSLCNAKDAEYVFEIDKRVKYVAIPLVVWVVGNHKARVVADGMKILFVLIDDIELAQSVQGWDVQVSLGENLATLSERFTNIAEDPGRGCVNKVELCHDCEEVDEESEDGMDGMDGIDGMDGQDGENGFYTDFEVRAVLSMEDAHIQVAERERSINGVVDEPAQT